MARVSHNEMCILTINHFPYLLQTASKYVYLVVMAIGFVLCTVKQVVSASTTVSLLVKSCLVMLFRFKLREYMVELQMMMFFQLNAVMHKSKVVPKTVESSL